MSRFTSITALFALILPGLPAGAQTRSGPPAAVIEAPDYHRVAGLVFRAPLVIDATVRSTARIAGPEAAGVPAGQARFYVNADVGALIRGSSALPPRIGFLIDVPLDARGRAPKLAKRRLILFARSVSGRADQIQLIDPSATLDWTAPADARVRAVVTAALSPDAPPAISSPGNAFHVPGTLPGEGETQVFLNTADGTPVSLLVLRRPGQARSWSVALGDIVGEAAPPPPRDSLLGYRLACELPAQLPESSLANTEPGTADAAREDYDFVRRQVGACGDPLRR